MLNKTMLITYPNSLGRDIKELSEVVDKYLKDVIGGIHILPFYPSSGDRGFAPMTYQEVDEAYGSWEDIKNLSKNYELMFDFMINHISKSSEYFKDFARYKEESEYYDLFIKYSDFWANGGPTEEQVELIYKRKPKAPYVDVTFADGSKDKVWCTFDEEQIDLDITKAKTREFIRNNLEDLCEKGAKIIRADAFAYVTKKIGTNCFFVEPDTWEVLEFVKSCVAPYDVEILPEIHEHYTIQQKIADHDYYVYDFALPMLVLHAIYAGTNHRLNHWLRICPRKQYTTLDTHDGIGVVDVKDLMSDEEIDFTKEALFSKGANVKKIYNTTKYNNLDIYQLNCTYYSALGDRDDVYLLARAIQFFAPGIPQVYYVGLLAGKNDIELIEKTKNGRDINRHNYTLDEIEQEVNRDVVKKLFALMKFRNTYKAFDGILYVNETGSNHELSLSWENEEYETTLSADLLTYTFNITFKDELGNMKNLSLD